MLSLPQKVTIQLRKLTCRHHMLSLPRKVTVLHHQMLDTLQHHQVLHLPWKVRLQYHQILHLPGEVTLQHHQILHLPQKLNITKHRDSRKITVMIYPRTSPNIIPATQNDSPDWSLSHMKHHVQWAARGVTPQTSPNTTPATMSWLICVRYETSFAACDRFDSYPSMTSKTEPSVHRVFSCFHNIFCAKRIQRFVLSRISRMLRLPQKMTLQDPKYCICCGCQYSS